MVGAKEDLPSRMLAAVLIAIPLSSLRSHRNRFVPLACQLGYTAVCWRGQASIMLVHTWPLESREGLQA
jgi:hypothetical protein